MNLIQLISQTSLEDVLAAMKQVHPDTSDSNLEGYSHLYRRILELEPAGEPATVRIERVTETYDGETESYLSVSKVDGDGKVWAADFWPWENMIISEVDDLAGLSMAEQIAAILWEMTFHGFSPEEVAEVSEELLSRVRDVEAND